MVEGWEGKRGLSYGSLGCLLQFGFTDCYNRMKYIYLQIVYKFSTVGLGGSVECASDWRPGGRGFDPRRGRQHCFVEIDYEIFSTAILSLPLIQEGQLSVSGERMCTILINRLED